MWSGKWSPCSILSILSADPDPPFIRIYIHRNGIQSIGAGTILRLAEQKWMKNNQDNQIQNITLCNICRVTFNYKLRYGKNWGAGCTSCFPNNFVREATVPPVSRSFTYVPVCKMPSPSTFSGLFLTISYGKNWASGMY